MKKCSFEKETTSSDSIDDFKVLSKDEERKKEKKSGSPDD